MTNNQLLKSLKRNLLLILALASVVFLSLFGLVACGDETTSVTDPTYTYTDTKTSGYFSNGGFSLGTADLDFSDYPKTSVTGWTKATDNSAKSSYVNSGAVNVSTNGWKELASTLYDDVDYRNYLINKGVYKVDDVKSAIKSSNEHKDDADYTPTDSDVKNYVVENYIVPLNPGCKDDDNFVYMLNNYATDKEYGLGSAQKLSASSSITLSAGKVGKISLWLKTQNVNGVSSEFGANIRLINNIRNTTQAEIRISNIIENEWTNYIIYVKPDSEFSCNFTLVLGLGYGNGSNNDATDYAEGTVYFDNITYESIEESQVPAGVKTYSLAFGSDTPIEVAEKTFLYDMSFSAPIKYFTEVALYDDVDNTDYYDYTKSNITVGGVNISSKTIVGNESTVLVSKNAGSTEFRLNKAGYTVKVDNNGANFVLDADNYCLITFKLNNSLTGFGSTDITLDLFDVYGTQTEKRANVATFEANESNTTYALLVKNNTEVSREFYINFVIGPADVGSVNYASDFATGTVTLSDLQVATGVAPDDDDANYNYYSFYQNLSSASVSLYAGLDSDTTESTTTESYGLTYAPSNIGEIVTQPTNPANYYGINAGHGYIQGGNNNKINTRSGKGEQGSYAGLINTKYLDNYFTEDTTFKNSFITALNHSGDDIQPIMIYNKTADHYGFIGNQTTVSADSYASVSVTLRVVGSAKANIYLVNTAEEDKPVMTFNNFTVNTDVAGATSNGTTVKGEDLKFALTVDSAMMEADGWVTVKFYIASGDQSKNFRVEVWNGDRTGSNDKASQGFVFVKDISVTSSSAFTESTRIEDTFSVSGNPLFDQKVSAFENDKSELIAYQRELTDLEVKFNNEYPDQAVSYLPTYVWAKNDTFIYAVYNTLETTETDPYDSITDDTDEDLDSGCTAKSDPSTFWLSFSSILLAVILILAIIALFVKNYRRKHRVSKNDAKSHYKVTSRTRVAKKNDEEPEQDETEDKSKTVEEAVSQPELQSEQKETTEAETEAEPEQQNLDEYVYGDVQDFGTEENTEQENSENSTDDAQG